MSKKSFNRLPDIFKLNTPNNKKLYKLLNYGYEHKVEVLNDIKESKDIDKAFGYTLDLHGKNVQEFRQPDMEDEIFRQYIKVKIIANRSKGDIETINKVMSFLTKDFLSIKEGWSSYAKEPASIIMNIKDTAKYIPNIINLIKSGGIKVYSTLSTNPVKLYISLKTYEFLNTLKITDKFCTEDDILGVENNTYINLNIESYEFHANLQITDLMTTETIAADENQIKVNTKLNSPHNTVMFKRVGVTSIGEGEI